MNTPINVQPLFEQVRLVIDQAQQQFRHTVNDLMVQSYWHIGRLIIEDEQGGVARAEYGKQTLNHLSKKLSAEYGKGFSPQSLWNFRQFYVEFPILSTAWRELRWSHYKILMRVKDPAARDWYANEAVAKYSQLADSQQLFASRYRAFLPTEAELQAELQRDRAVLENGISEGEV